MGKLYFKYGTLFSGKTLNLLSIAHRYKEQGKKIYLINPNDTFIESSTGLSEIADIEIVSKTQLSELSIPYNVDLILVDDAHLLTAKQVEDLRNFVVDHNTQAICFGLRTTFLGEFFTGSRRLMELADVIEEIKTTCNYCNENATMNLRHSLEPFQLYDYSINNDEYTTVCYECFKEKNKWDKYVPLTNVLRK